MAGLLDAPIGRWLDIAAVGLLLGLGLGKLAQVLGGSGQGVVSGADWATAYLGAGPVGRARARPAGASRPRSSRRSAMRSSWSSSSSLGRLGPFQRANGRRFLVALGGWAVVRFVVATWWRDAAVARLAQGGAAHRHR